MIKTLKPATPDLIVRDPMTAQALPAEGKAKPMTTYWRRRLKDGDVIVVTDKKPASGKTAKKDT